MKRFLILLWLAGSALALAQDLEQPPPGLRRHTQHVTAAPVAPVALRAGRSAQVELSFRVAPGFHINSNKPNSNLLVPTVISMSPPTNLAVAKITYPAGHDLSFAFSPNEKLSVYSGDFTLGAVVSAARSMPPGRFRVRGDPKYQACDDKSCYPPNHLPVAFDVTISNPSRRHRAR